MCILPTAVLAQTTPTYESANPPSPPDSLQSIASIKCAVSLASEPFLLLPVLSHVSFPAVSASKPTVEELVALFSESLEADETEVLSRNNGLLTFAANVDCPEFHGSLLALLALLVNRFISQLSRSLSAFCRRARDVSMDLHSVDDSADLDNELIPRDVQSYRL